MITLTLPDGRSGSVAKGTSVFEFAKKISLSLAKKAVAARVNEIIVDLSFLLEASAHITILTPADAAGLDVIRHSTAHLLAQAVKRLFPEAQVAIGPIIEDGFYYDFANVRPFTPEDLEKIEKVMRDIVKENLIITRRVSAREEAIASFQAQGETFKAQIIQDIPSHDALTLYKQGEFEDLCRGPHVPATGHLKVFKLLRVAGAYWRGDHRNPMLQRIYGTAFATQEALDLYLFRLEEAEKRDHRKIGKALDLFHFQDIAPGMVFWHAKGWALYQTLERYTRARLKEYAYQEIKTPQLVDRVLWEQSGHWAHFREAMFITQTENREYAIKPMNCPCHVQVFNASLRSYRELPLRYAEFGNCHRCEPSGSLHGLMRVRNFVQDDAHVFCMESQIQSEVVDMLKLVQSMYHDLGLAPVFYRLALRPSNRVGEDVLWDKAESALKQAMQSLSISWEDAPGEGAFYGPKIECSLADSLGRVWQCGTIQIDFSMPTRLGASYIAEDGSRQVPVMIHRALLGTFERLIGILIEHYAGKLPFWLSPIQASVLTISEGQAEFAAEVAAQLKKNEIRVELDLRNEKIGFKIREHTLQRVSYLLVIGMQEVSAGAVSIRTRDGENLGTYPVCRLMELFVKANAQRCELAAILEE